MDRETGGMDTSAQDSLVEDLISAFDSGAQVDEDPPEQIETTKAETSPKDLPVETTSSPAPETSTSAPDASASSEAPADAAKVDPFAGGDPFVFRADRQEIKPEGARIVGDKIVFDKASWPAFQSRYIADRTVWRQQQAGWDRARADYEARLVAKTPEQEKAVAFAREIDRISKLTDPREIQAIVQHWQTHWPSYLLSKENEMLKERATQWTTAQQREADQAALDDLVPEMHEHLTQGFDHYLGQPALKILGPRKDALLAEYLETEGDVRSGGRAYTWNEKEQAYFLDEPRLLRFLEREAKREHEKVELVKKHTEATKKNQAALKPTAAPKPAPTERDTKGRFTKDSLDDDDRHERELTSVDFWFGKG